MINMISKQIEEDYFRFTGTSGLNLLKLLKIRKNHAFMALFWFRKSKKANIAVFKRIYRHFYDKHASKNGIEIPASVNLGGGVLLIHPYNITINSKVSTGMNLTLLKGCTIGNIKGEHGGAPIIGNNVYIGLNATVIGNITIGDDVLISANSFVNFDVPEHSVVIGNPGVIHKKCEATKLYITNRIE